MWKKYYYVISVLIFGVLLVFIFLSKRNKEKTIVELNISVNYDEKKFTIKNNDTINYVYADIAIDQYYILKNINLKAGEEYTIWQVEFLHYNGKHYPQNKKPYQFSIWCELDNGKKGFYSKRIK